MVRRVINFVHTTYERYERLISSVSLVGGFVFDAVTLTRVDEFLENFWVIVHLLVAATGIILININERMARQTEFSRRIHFWLTIVIQFGFGGLLSVFLVFYFRSGTLASSWPFLLLLALLFVFNELLKQHYSRLVFQISVLFLSTFSFLIFFVPVVLHRIGNGVFLISGSVSLIFTGLFVIVLRYITHEQFKKNRWLLTATVLGLYAMINVFYFTNLIPPLPLSLKEGGVYHSLKKNTDGKYEATTEPTTWLHYFKSTQDFHYKTGETVYAYSAVFSPTNLNTSIVHRWQQYDPVKKMWVTKSLINLAIAGGREGGYRTYSSKLNISPGLWRVDVETSNGKDIGRIKFNIIESKDSISTEKIEL